MARITAWLALLLTPLFAASPSLAATGGPGHGMRILHHEALQMVSSDATGRNLEFDAYGRRFALRLERNERLAFLSAARTPGVEALRGTVASPGAVAGTGSGTSVAGSWVRLTRTPAGLYGMIYDGQDLYAVEPAREAAGHVVGALEAQGNAPVIYRLADTLLPPGEASCGTSMSLDQAIAADAQTELQQYQALAVELQALAATLPSRQIQLAVVGDNEFSQLTFSGGLTPEAAIAARFNVVDGIFSAQVGVKINVADVNVFRTADPFSDTTVPATLLDELAGWRQLTPAQNSRGLTHMLTGKDLDGTTVGIAFVGSVCRARSGSGLSQGNLSATNSALVIAHEMGHNFGAIHDGDVGSACETTAQTFLMAPRLNGSSEFSQCSLASIAPVVAAATCLTALSVPDADFDLPTPTPRLRGASFSYDFNVRSVGAVAVENVGITITLPTALAGATATVSGGAACTAANNVLSCSIGSLAPQATRAVTLTLAAQQSGSFAVNTALTSSNDAVAFNNTGRVTFVINPSADLAVELSAAPASFVTGGTSQVTAMITQLSGDPVTDAALTFGIPAGLTVSNVAANQLGCALLNAAVTCSGGALTAGASRSVVLTVTAQQPGARQLTASVRATLGDPVGANDTAQLTLDTTAAAASGGGGGGGALDLLQLLALLGLALRVSSSAGPAGSRRSG
jgi:hypothetical protein